MDIETTSINSPKFRLKIQIGSSKEQESEPLDRLQKVEND